MAQHDMDIANQGFPATRADLNNALQALVSNSSGATAPSTTFANQWWYDTTNNKMYIRNEANNAWIEVFTLDQTNNEWQLTTGVVQAKDSDGLALKTDDGTTRLFIKDADGNIGIGTVSPGDARLALDDTHTTTVTDASTLLGNTTFKINGNSGQGTDQMRMGPMCSAGAYFIDVSNSTGGADYNLVINPFNNGNLGISQSSPAAKIHASIPSVTNTSTEIFRLSDEVLCDFKVFLNRSGTLGGSVSALNTASGVMAFETANTERFRVTGNQFLIGAASSVGSSLAGLELSGTQGNNHIKSAVTLTSGYDAVVFINGNGTVGRITTSGSGTTYSTSSDYRLKENVTDVTDGITRLKQLSPKRFNFIADADTILDGFLAHEAQAVVPEAVTGTHDGMTDEDYEVSAATGDIYTPATEEAEEVIHSSNVVEPETLEEGQLWRETTAAVMGTRSVPDYQGIDQSKLVPLLTAALQEAIAKIEALETRVAALEGA